MGLLQQQRVLDGAGRAVHQVAQLGPLGHVHTGQVEHADALALRVEQWGAGTAVAGVVVEEVLAPVQPHRLQLGQGCADGGGAHGRLRQVDAHAPDGMHPCVAVVDGALHVHRDAARIGEHREVVHAGDGTGEMGQHRPRRLQQMAVLLCHAAQHGGAHQVERHALAGRMPLRQAALPGAHDPGLDAQRRRHLALAEQGGAGAVDQVLALVWR